MKSTVAELREMLKAKGLSTIGNKAELVARLESVGGVGPNEPGLLGDISEELQEELHVSLLPTSPVVMKPQPTEPVALPSSSSVVEKCESAKPIGIEAAPVVPKEGLGAVSKLQDRMKKIDVVPEEVKLKVRADRMPSVQGQNWVQCVRCERWEIYENTGLAGKFNALTVGKLDFLCRLCGLENMIEDLRAENVSLKNKLTSLEKEHSGGVKSYSSAVRGEMEKSREELRNEMIALVKNKVSEELACEYPDTKEVENLVAKAVATKSEEDIEIDRRKNNIIVYRAQMSPAKDPADRVVADNLFLKELFEGPLELGNIQDGVLKVIRLRGKDNSNDADRVSPMLIKLSSEEVKNKIMSSLKKLKNADVRFKRISVAHDLTVKQREVVRCVLSKAKQEYSVETRDETQQGNWVWRVVNHQRNPRAKRVKVN
jgi:hypothetical protein